MIANRIFGLLRLQILAQSLIVAAVYWGWLWVMEALIYGEPFLRGPYLSYFVVAEVAILFEWLTRESEKRNLLQRKTTRHPHVCIRQVIYLTVALSLYLVLSKDLIISRAFLLSFLAIAFLSLNLSEYFLSRLLSHAIFGSKGDTRTLLVGSAGSVFSFQQWAHEKHLYSLKILGALSDDDESMFTGTLDGMRIGGEDEFARQLKAQKIDQVVLVEPLDDIRALSEMIRLCEMHGIRFVLVNDLSGATGKKLTSKNLDGMNLVFLYEEPLEDPLNQFLKRVFDVCVAAVACVTILPIGCLITWAIHRKQSRGRLFYKQTRIGMNGVPFEIYKFRSLHDTEHNEGKQVNEQDERVFSGGRFIRKYSIDELPQFINVLKGEMSVIGPRPHFLEHDQYFAKLLENYRTRSLVKPGITGLAQVRGFRGNTEGDVSHIQQRILSDIAYLENWSLKLDFVILFRTIYHMIFPPRTAY
jgi:exopolysaccharide biosynthesis polyprenyl glycosylphosphotransferase